MKIDYDHSANPHTLEGSTAAWENLFPDRPPASVLDVGCGTGTWLRAAINNGVKDIIGVDGVDISPEELLFPKEDFLRTDLSNTFDLGRRFEIALCLEVGEHLEPEAACGLVRSLTRHSDTILFSAASPGQDGQHHVNCQWPIYWQTMFNAEGYACEDSPRWTIWNNSLIEPWYRQNMFAAHLNDSAGNEPRILSVIHPEMHERIRFTPKTDEFKSHVSRIENGGMPPGWYFKTLVGAMICKVRRRFG